MSNIAEKSGRVIEVLHQPLIGKNRLLVPKGETVAGTGDVASLITATVAYYFLLKRKKNP